MKAAGERTVYVKAAGDRAIGVKTVRETAVGMKAVGERAVGTALCLCYVRAMELTKRSVNGERFSGENLKEQTEEDA